MCRSCINIERAKLGPFIERRRDGYVWFANRVRRKGRFADRVWAVFRDARIKRKCLRKPLDTSVIVRKASASRPKTPRQAKTNARIRRGIWLVELEPAVAIAGDIGSTHRNPRGTDVPFFH